MGGQRHALFDKSRVVKDLVFSRDGFHLILSGYKIASRFYRKRFCCSGKNFSCYPVNWITCNLWSYPVSKSKNTQGFFVNIFLIGRLYRNCSITGYQITASAINGKNPETENIPV